LDAGETAFVGYLEGLDVKWCVVGWVRPLSSTLERLQVRLVEGATTLASDSAERFRGDLLEAEIGDGYYGFMLQIPPHMFDGACHELSVRVLDVPGSAILGELELHLPSRPPSKNYTAQVATASDLLCSVLGRAPPTQSFNILTHFDELSQAFTDIARIYDHATALGLLYIHVLHRRIDEDGLKSRLTRLSRTPEALPRVIGEILDSEEAQKLYRDGAEYRFPAVTALTAWTELRRDLPK